MSLPTKMLTCAPLQILPEHFRIERGCELDYGEIYDRCKGGLDILQEAARFAHPTKLRPHPKFSAPRPTWGPGLGEHDIPFNLKWHPNFLRRWLFRLFKL